MTEATRPERARKPGPRAVIWASIALFVVLFALVSYRVGSSIAVGASAGRSSVVRKVVKRRVVTTIVPSPGGTSVSAAPALTSESSSGAPIATGAS
jgi:hypothetical protein